MIDAKNAHQGMNVLMAHTPLKNCTSSSHNALSTCTQSSTLPKITAASIAHFAFFTQYSAFKNQTARLAQVC